MCVCVCVCVRACARACVRACVVLLLLLFTITDRVGWFNYGVYTYTQLLQKLGGGKADAAVFREGVRWTQA